MAVISPGLFSVFLSISTSEDGWSQFFPDCLVYSVYIADFFYIVPKVSIIVNIIIAFVS